MPMDPDEARKARLALKLPKWMETLAEGEELYPFHLYYHKPYDMFEFDDLTPMGQEVVPLWESDHTVFAHWVNPHSGRPEFLLFHTDLKDSYRPLGSTPKGVAGWLIAGHWDSCTEPDEYAAVPEIAERLEFDGFHEFIKAYAEAWELTDEFDDDEDANPEDDPVEKFW